MFQQWRIPRQVPSDADWQQAVHLVANEKAQKDLVVIAPAWAVQGRTYFKNLITWKDFGRFDTRLYRRIFEISSFGESAPETDGLSPERVDTFGKITVKRYKLPPPDEILYDFTDHIREAEASKAVERRPKIIIDHWFFPRRVISIKLNASSTLTFRDVPLGGVLRGYGVIDYREGRFNKGAPAKIVIFVNEKKLGRITVANFGPLKPFELKLPQRGTGTVRFEISQSGNPRRELGLAADVRRMRGER